MLYTKTVYPNTLQLLKKIQTLDSLKMFSLAGETGLSLYYGHRISVDIDLFYTQDFNVETIILEINSFFKNDNISILSKEKNSILLSINDVKIDILAHQYPLIKSSNIYGNIKLYAKEDIIAMKLNALANRGTKKDFFDIYEVLQTYSLENILSFFTKKYVNNDTFYILRSLVYFKDAENDKDPIMIKKYNWEKVKSSLNTFVEAFLNKD